MNIIHFDSLNSTNLYAKKNIESLNHFDVIETDIQTNGYGQWGRKWINTGFDNIYMTIILKPDNDINFYTDIVRYTAICICNVLKTYKVTPTIKEPNDILINNKKICGILAESITKGDKSKGIIIGTGINLNTDKETLLNIDQPATSLNIELKQKVNKNIFINQVLNEFENNYENYLKKRINLKSFL